MIASSLPRNHELHPPRPTGFLESFARGFSLHSAAFSPPTILSRLGAFLCLFVLALGNTPHPASAADAATNTITPRQVAKLKSVADAVISPDSRRIAYVVSVPRNPGVDDDGEPWTELWVQLTRTNLTREFITGKINVEKAGWSRDSRFIYFLAKRYDDKFKSVHRIAAHGGEATKVIALESAISDFSLSPDGKQLAVLATEPEDPKVKKRQDQGFRQEIHEEDSLPTRVFVTTPFAISRVAPVRLQVEGSVRQVHWHPSEARLAIAVTPTPSVDDGMMRNQLLVVNATNSTVEARIDHLGKLGQFGWNADGSQLALISAADLSDPSAGRLMVVAASGGKPRDVLPNLEAAVTEFAWVGSQKIQYVADQGVESIYSEVDVNGTQAEPKVIAAKGGPIWTSLSVANSGSFAALVGHSPAHPPELFMHQEGENKSPARLTDSNPWLASISLAAQEIVRHKAKDGLELEGVLIRPLQAKEGTPVSLILAVHGGPESHISHGWLTSYSNPGQMAAASGFAVFYPNYRGSTGRGVAFSKLGQADAAGKEFDDLIDAVDHLIGLGIADPKRVGITGGSYGGYATAWCSTKYSARFAAGVMFVGISDKISKVGTTDIPDEEFHVHARKRPWDDWQFLLERSPIFHTENAATPLLILHGKDDPRVNVGQSRELFRHLKMRGKAPVRLVLYPGEGHGNRKAAARFDYNLRMLEWFDRYLNKTGTNLPATELEYP